MYLDNIEQRDVFLLEFALKNVCGWSYMKVTCFLKFDSYAEWMKSQDTEVSVRFNRQFLKEERLVLETEKNENLF